VGNDFVAMLPTLGIALIVFGLFYYTTWQVIALPGEIEEDKSNRRRINPNQDDTHVAARWSARDDTPGNGPISRCILPGRGF
jgi:hypothetical protein